MNFKKCLGIFLSAVLAGIMISIGGSIFITLSASGDIMGKIFGASFFAVGLFTILIFGLHLFTGKVGYLFLPGDSYKEKAIMLLLTLLGNCAGTFLFGSALSHRFLETTKIITIVETKLDMSLLTVFLLAIGCGILMFCAVHGYKTADNGASRAVIVLFSVAGFILAGFEHSIADMFYVAAAGMISLRSLLLLLVVILGNAVGGAGFAALCQVARNALTTHKGDK